MIETERKADGQEQTTWVFFTTISISGHTLYVNVTKDLKGKKTILKTKTVKLKDLVYFIIYALLRARTDGSTDTVNSLLKL